MSRTVKCALIFGVGGQDGAYLAQLLLAKGYQVHGTSRDIEVSSFAGLKQLGVHGKVRLHSANLNEFRSVLQVLRDVAPAEIYNLSAQSSVGLSFGQPIETVTSIVDATLNVMEAMRFLGGSGQDSGQDSDHYAGRFYNASSSEMFGDTGTAAASETTQFHPRSPYGVSKAAAHWLVETYRNAYGLYACSGILFNHESPLRKDRFVTQKIIRAVVDIHLGGSGPLHLGDISVSRDWGWAPDYVDAMWRMLQQPKPDDFVIATGRTDKLEDFVRTAFEHFGLDWSKHVVSDQSLRRPYEIDHSVGDATKAAERLGWRATQKMPQVVALLIEAELQRRKHGDAA